MTPAEEKYVHHVSCIDDLNRAWSILQELRRASERTAVHAAAFAFALIEYAKPYTRSDGVYKQGRHGYALPPPDLEPEELALHHQILNLRRQALAHSDLTFKEATVYRDARGGVSRPGVISNVPPLPDCDAVIRLIERTLDRMYADRVRMEGSLTYLA